MSSSGGRNPADGVGYTRIVFRFTAQRPWNTSRLQLRSLGMDPRQGVPAVDVFPDAWAIRKSSNCGLN